MKPIEDFLDYLRYERNYSEKTVINYGTDLKQFKQFVEEEKEVFRPAETDARLIRHWIMALTGQGYTAVSVNCKLSALRAFYKYLLKQGAVTANPLYKIKGPKNKKALPAFLKESEMNRLLDETDYGGGFTGDRDRLIISVFYHTGMRLSELIELNNADVDFSASLIKVTGKRNKQRLIPFGDELKNELFRYLRFRDETFPERSEALFVGKNGMRLTKRMVGTLVSKHLSKAVTQKKRSPHVLRHTFATALLNNQAELSAVKELLGHAGLAATQLYTHTTFEELKKVYKQAHPRV